MTTPDYIALLPWIVLTAAPVVVMLAIAAHRAHGPTALLSIAGMVLALLAIAPAATQAPRAVTPLLAVDGFALFFLALMLLAAVAVIALAWPWLLRQGPQAEEFHLLVLLATLGAAVLVASTHYASLLLGLETLSVALFALAAYPVFRERPLEAGVKYLILAGVAAAFLLFGVALIYARSGALEFGAVQQALTTGRPDPFIVIGLLLVVAGLAFKLSLVPFHLWTPDVYEGAPPPVTAFLATISKGAAFVLVLRYLLATDAHAAPVVVAGLTLAGVVTMVVGNLLALLQDDIKRILAYSSMAHMGYLLVPLMAGSSLAIETAGYYLFAYFVMNLAAFGVVTLIDAEGEGGAHTLERYRGLMWRRPWLAAVLASALFALAGMPLTVGFVAKFYLFVAGVDGRLWLLLAALVVGSAIGLFYYLRIIIHMVAVAGEGPARAAPVRGAWSGHLTLGVLLALLVLFGVYPAPVVSWIQFSAVSLAP